MSGAHRFVTPGTEASIHEGCGLMGLVAAVQAVRFVEVFATSPVA